MDSIRQSSIDAVRAVGKATVARRVVQGDRDPIPFATVNSAPDLGRKSPLRGARDLGNVVVDNALDLSTAASRSQALQ